MSALFNGHNSDSDGELKINTEYAKNYDKWRQKEELNKLKTKYGDINKSGSSGESESESSSSEEEENELQEQFDKDFYKTLALLKKKDPQIYNKDVTFFDDTNKAQELQSEKRKEKTKKEKGIFLRDYERKIIVERDGKFSDSEDETDSKNKKEKFKKITYAEEQKQLKESFKNAVQYEEDDDLLKPKIKSETEKQKEEADYKEWLKGQEAHINENEQELLKPLRDFWTDPKLNANEKFLRDYILNNKYLDNDYGGSAEDGEGDESHLIHDSDVNLSEDERNIEKQEEFEHKYNFRFEEPDQEFIKRYPRTMENSLRRKDTRRAQKRAEVKKRKEEEKLKKKEELKQLKALKRKEIEEKIEKLKEITGNDDVQFNDIDLDADFDPSEHDRKMTQIFNDEYYAGPEGDIKPEFPDIDEELDIEQTWDNYDPATENYADEGEYNEPHCEDEDFIMDADYDSSKKIQAEIEGSKRKRRRRKSKFAELLAKEKPKFDPKHYKTYEEYFDKYYSLDYEDMIGDIPCRFKYRKVVPNDYGLSIEEILMADDKELNKWCSLKKALQYRPEHAELNDVQMYKQKARNEAIKKKILKSLYTNPEEEEGADGEKNANNASVEENAEKTKTIKKKKKSQKTKNNVVQTIPQTSAGDTEATATPQEIKNGISETQEVLSETSKTEKRKKSKIEIEQPEAKKQKANREEPENSISEDKPDEGKETLEKPIDKGLSRKGKNNKQNNDKKKQVKDSKKAKLREKIRQKKLDRKMGKGLKKEPAKNDIASLDPERLKMYGINAKKLKNKLKYGKK